MNLMVDEKAKIREFVNSRGSGRTSRIIESIPDDIEGPLWFVVYNPGMIPYTKDLILRIKGKEFLRKTRVMSVYGNMRGISPNKIYFDHTIFEEFYYENLDENMKEEIKRIINLGSMYE